MLWCDTVRELARLHKTLLRKCVIFSALPPRFLVPLLRQLRPMVAVPGQIIVREGHRNRFLYFIHRGLVTVVSASSGHVAALERS